MFTFCIIMITIASILLILAVLVQSPKSGMAANFGAANQTMGVRQTTNFLEKFTWAMVAAVVFFSLLSVVALPKSADNAATAGADKAVAGAENITNPQVEDITLDEPLAVEAVPAEEGAEVEAIPVEEGAKVEVATETEATEEVAE